MLMAMMKATQFHMGCVSCLMTVYMVFCLRKWKSLLKVGDLVFVKLHDRVGVIVKLSEPTINFPYQVADVLFTNGIIDEMVTTSLRAMNKGNDNITIGYQK